MFDAAEAFGSISDAFKAYAAAASAASGPPPLEQPPLGPPSASTSAVKRSFGEMQAGGTLSLSDDPSKKPASAKPVPMPDEKAWEAALKRIPRCSAVEGIRESSVFSNQMSQHGAGGGRTNCLRKLLQELGSLERNLPTNPAIWIRFDAETPQFLRTLITAPTGTPYALGLFCFDIYVPDNYPQSPPKMHLLTTGNGTVRFSPNLYSDGKVCLSLLNTWSGPKWNSNHSSLLQVLVSIQGLILGVEHPYYLEPGYGGWEGHKNAHVPPQHVKRDEDRMRVGTVKYALLETVKGGPRHLQPFREVIDAHFFHYRDAISEVTRDWNSSMASSSLRGQGHDLKQSVAELGLVLNDLKDPFGGESTQDDSKDASAKEDPAKPMAKTTGEEAGGECAEIASKRRAMEEAVAQQDYVTAGRLQSELQHFNGVQSKISSKKKEMDEAASKGDYITAGELQVMVNHLEQNRHLLQDLERRMFDAAAKLDFVRAGRFQEQYKILLDPEGSSKAATAASMGPSFPSSGMVFGGPPPPPPPAVFTSFGPFGPPPSYAEPYYDGGGGGGHEDDYEY